MNSKQSKCITIYDIYEKFKTKYNNIMKDFEQKGKLDNSNNYKDFYQQCVSEFKQLTLNEDLIKKKGPDGLDIKPANCSEFDIENQDSSIVKSSK